MSTTEEEMSIFPKVPDLLDRAFEVFYNDLLCKATQNTVESVRKWIDQQLPMASMRKKIRGKCFDRLMDSYSEDKCSLIEKRADIVAVLDCILNERFLEEQNGLCLQIPFLSMKSISKLLSVIGHRCPGLEYLEMKFHGGYKPIDSSDGLVSVEQIQQGPVLSSLRSLTLNFNGMNPYESSWNCNTSVLGIIGKCCPTLSCLNYYGIGLRKKDVLELIFVGDLAAILFPSYEFYEMSEEDLDSLLGSVFGKPPNGTPPAFDGNWSRDSVLPGLRVPPEFLNPLCSTLEKFDYFDDWGFNQDPFTDSLLAFALRHLPNLVTQTPSHDKVVPLIKLIYKTEKMLEVRDLNFGEACRKAAQSIGFQVNPLITPTNLNYDDFLALKKLDNIPLNDADTLRAIGCFCPLLEQVHFFARNTDIDVDELQSILNKWPKVKVLKLYNVHPQCLPPVLNVFGSALESLQLEKCPTPIDLALLAPCIALEDLSISHCTVTCEGKDPSSRWTSETFLPSLNSLVTYKCCLGVWAYLLETKSTLMHLHLDCVHIGTNGHEPHLEWNQIPSLWPNLEYLYIGQCTGLTMMEVSSLIAKTENLMEIWFPVPIFSEDPTLTESIIQHFQDVNIAAVPNRDAPRTCPYQQL